MAKILGSWSSMRKYLEQDMLAETLEGRIRYGCTAYTGMDGCHVFEICVDRKQIKRFSWETVNSYFIKKGYKKNTKPNGAAEYWEEFWTLLEKYSINDRTEYTDEEFCNALKVYRNEDIQKSMHSGNPLIKMFAILDRRAGKRTLIQIQQEIMQNPLWLQKIYKLRTEAEGMYLIP